MKGGKKKGDRVCSGIPRPSCCTHETLSCVLKISTVVCFMFEFTFVVKIATTLTPA